MTLYTRAGDTGTTRTFSCDQRISKSSTIAEALGTLDEVNSFLGLCVAGARDATLALGDSAVADIVRATQETLFIIQAELAGAPGKTVSVEKVKEIEQIVDHIEKELPPIKTFFIPGADELSARFDSARTIARRAERRVVAVIEEGKTGIGEYSLAYLNRLSSLLYALARHANHVAGVTEMPPSYT
jgi:cob(I)alamin adenosyltransferase